MIAYEAPLVDQIAAPVEMDVADFPHVSRAGRFGGLCLAVVAAASLISCTSEGSPTDAEEPDDRSIAAAPLNSATPRPELPDAPCDVFNLVSRTRAENIERSKDKAKDCEQAMQNGRVALLTFDTPPKRAQKIADGIEKSLPAATDNKISPTVEVVQATEAAEKRWNDAIASTGCVDIENSETFASQNADAAMPELAEYDFIVSLTDTLACTPKTPGVASRIGGRHAEVFVPAVKKMVAAAGGGDPDDMLVKVGAHETGHEYGLGHDGSSAAEQPGGFYSPTVEVGPKPADILGMAAEGQYSEYATGPLMGLGVQSVGPEAVSAYPIGTVQQNCLNWPAIVTKGPKADKAETVGADGVTITSQEAAEGKYAYVDLDTPVTIDPSEGDSGELVVGGVAIVPQAENEGSKPIYGSEVILTADEGCTVVSLGHTEGPDKWSFQAGGKTYKVDLNAKRIKVSAA
jgi:hypothetical protein